LDEKYCLINLLFADDQIIGNQRKISLFMLLNLGGQFYIKIALIYRINGASEEKFEPVGK
jgi:hypothetical protein